MLHACSWHTISSKVTPGSSGRTPKAPRRPEDRSCETTPTFLDFVFVRRAPAPRPTGATKPPTSAEASGGPTDATNTAQTPTLTQPKRPKQASTRRAAPDDPRHLGGCPKFAEPMTNNCPKVAPAWPHFGEIRPLPSHSGSMWSINIGQRGPTFGHCRLHLAGLCYMLVMFDRTWQFWASLDRCWPM